MVDLIQWYGSPAPIAHTWAASSKFRILPLEFEIDYNNLILKKYFLSTSMNIRPQLYCDGNSLRRDAAVTMDSESLANDFKFRVQVQKGQGPDFHFVTFTVPAQSRLGRVQTPMTTSPTLSELRAAHGNTEGSGEAVAWRLAIGTKPVTLEILDKSGNALKWVGATRLEKTS